MSNSLSQKYQKKSDREHVLDNPDTYIGSIENVNQDYFVYDQQDNIIKSKNIKYIPGLYKLFDEAIVNSRDHVMRMQQTINNQESCDDKDSKLIKNYPVTQIKVDIDEITGMITIINDGNGIDVCMHPEYNVWIPELIFGHLRTSTNYDKQEKRIVGGKNGFGFKLVLIWSTWGKIETVDHKTKKRYTQEFIDNLTKIEKPKIERCTNRPYTRISFIPDYKRLGIEGISSDLISLFKKRVYDIAAVTDKQVKVYYNNNQLDIKTFQNYVDYYIGDKKTYERLYESNNDRWEYIVCISPYDEFRQVSFVNGIYTYQGGKHVDYIVNQITKKMTVYIKSRQKIDVKSSSIKEQLMIFLNCTIDNPSFDSQTKDHLNTSVQNFGSICEVSDKFVEKLAKMGVMDTACSITHVKQDKVAKKTDGTKCKTIRNIPKLDDANYAGTNKSSQCTLILCEGDSAKSGIISGLSREDRNLIGVYPMKGKMFNTRGENITKISENREITDIKQILGLENGREYTQKDVETILRYGKILFMTDQDLDGSHIKGLGINMIDSQWQSLTRIPDFIGYMNTPILKATSGKKIIEFYNEGEFAEWKKINDVNKWSVKYFKGLGTSTSKEFKQYFEKKKIVNFTNTDICSDNIDKIFNKKRTQDRKLWLSEYDREKYLDTNRESVSYSEFIDNELIHFSKYDNDRSIPNIMDGLKISLRKIIYAAFKKKLNSEIKVAQFSGYVSEHSGYHHGEMSLNMAIIGLAQDYVGSNNINLLMPNGSFGTRINGGRDAASERYIFTQLSKITRLIYPDIDDNILNYVDDDGQLVEPVFYVPIIPMILVNGSRGIGTGFSTDIMCYNPKQIIEYLEAILNGMDIEKRKSLSIDPFYRGFNGTITTIDNDKSKKKYIIKGVYSVVGKDKIKITELPIGTWTQDYKEYLESIVASNNKDRDKDRDKSKKTKTVEFMIKDYTNMSTDTTVEFTVTLLPGSLDKLLSENHDNNINGIERSFKLYSTHSTSNMHLFDSSEKLKQYTSVEMIIEDYYHVRYAYYQKRKEYLITKLGNELKILSNKAKYIKCVLDDEIDLRKKTREQIYNIMKSHKFDIGEDDSYNYLIKMPMDSVSQENVDKLMKEHSSKQQQLDSVKADTVEKVWLQELCQLKINI